MKIKCIKVLNADRCEVEFSPWITLGKVYHVMGILIDSDGKRSYVIISNDRDPGWAAMVSHPSECFEIISTKIPSNWKFWVDKDSSIGITPAAWQVEGFSEAFYDSDPATYPIFERERDIIMQEDP